MVIMQKHATFGKYSFGFRALRGGFGVGWKLLFLGIIGLFVLSFAFQYRSASYPVASVQEYPVASAVVTIYCEGSDGDSSGGSGIIFSEDGFVLTNAHIFPESVRVANYAADAPCLVALPDPRTGSPREVYSARPVFIESLSDEYDLAFVQIYDVFFRDGISYGEYPRRFPAYVDHERCADTPIAFGESILVYGYPAVSGGHTLTVTDGIVSSLLLDDGMILTSAKISHGNSGGLAVDQHGCMIGVPSMVTGDEYETFGLIISNDLIDEFIVSARNLGGPNIVRPSSFSKKIGR